MEVLPPNGLCRLTATLGAHLDGLFAVNIRCRSPEYRCVAERTRLLPGGLARVTCVLDPLLSDQSL